MKLPLPLISGRLVRRYQRFFAEVELDDGRTITAHTPNTGRMMQCAIPGYPVLVSAAANRSRKLPWTLELIKVNGFWVDTNTQRSNRVVEEGLRNDLIAGLTGYKVQPEYAFGASRLDFMLEKGGKRVLLEVKNVTLCINETTACFPDAVTIRGQKHLRELYQARLEGYRTAVLFLVQRGEANTFSPADHIDPDYGRWLRKANEAGVEIFAYRTLITECETRIDQPLPVLL